MNILKNSAKVLSAIFMSSVVMMSFNQNVLAATEVPTLKNKTVQTQLNERLQQPVTDVNVLEATKVPTLDNKTVIALLKEKTGQPASNFLVTKILTGSFTGIKKTEAVVIVLDTSNQLTDRLSEGWLFRYENNKWSAIEKRLKGFDFGNIGKTDIKMDGINELYLIGIAISAEEALTATYNVIDLSRNNKVLFSAKGYYGALVPNKTFSNIEHKIAFKNNFLDLIDTEVNEVLDINNKKISSKKTVTNYKFNGDVFVKVK
ncbi:MAG: hypothetical protein AB6733_01970 [Clostridiaceae bacterium]